MKSKTLIITIIAAVAIAACSSETEDAASAPTSDIAMDAAARLPGIAVEAQTVSTGSLIGEITSSGLIRGVAEAWVISETQGVVESAPVGLGANVAEDDILVTFDENLQELQLRQAQTQLESAQLDLAATLRLYNSGNASQAQLSRAQSTAAGAEAATETARRALANRTIRAPITGRIADIADGVSRGNYMTPGSRVVRIIDTSRVQVELALGEREIQFVQPGSLALVQLPVCSTEPIDAVVTAVAAAGDPATGSFAVIVEWPNQCGDAVRAGMSVEVSIPPTIEPSLIVPATAVQVREGEHYVFLADNGLARRVLVSVGNRSGNAVEIREGLSAGDTIVTTGLSRLTDESEIAVTLVGDAGAL